MKLQIFCLFAGLFFLVMTNVTWAINPSVILSGTIAICGAVLLAISTFLGISKGEEDDES